MEQPTEHLQAVPQFKDTWEKKVIATKWKRGQKKQCEVCSQVFEIKYPRWCRCCSRKCGAALRIQENGHWRNRLEAHVLEVIRRSQAAVHPCEQCGMGRCVEGNRCGVCRQRMSDQSVRRIRAIVGKVLQQRCRECGGYAGYYQHRCVECRQIKQLQDKRKKREQKGYRARCRKYGVFYDPAVTLQSIFDRDGGRCEYCDRKVSRNRSDWRKVATIDHVTPLSRGGTHTFDNVVLACMECNTKKATTQWTLF